MRSHLIPGEIECGRDDVDQYVERRPTRCGYPSIAKSIGALTIGVVTKPFSFEELLARVRTRLRRTSDNGGAEHVRAGDLDIDVAGHQVRRGDIEIGLTPLEFDLLVTLARTPWKVFTREELLSQVWGYQHPADTRLVNVHVQRLRAKIESDPENPTIVQTVRGVGYRAGAPTSS